MTHSETADADPDIDAQSRPRSSSTINQATPEFTTAAQWSAQQGSEPDADANGPPTEPNPTPSPTQRSGSQDTDAVDPSSLGSDASQAGDELAGEPPSRVSDSVDGEAPGHREATPPADPAKPASSDVPTANDQGEDAPPAAHSPPPYTGPPGFNLLSTGCEALDDLLDGGLESDAVTLVFGEGGSGKTNLALQCSRGAAADGRVAFVDTEGVSPRRLAQIMAATPDEARRLHFFKPLDLEQQTKMVEQATKLPDLRLIVLDSINMHYRLHMDSDDERAASRHLYKQLHRLTAFARSHEVPVLVTGQVYGDEDQTHPFARRLMEHLVKASIRFEKRPDGLRRATIVKHRSIPEGGRTRFRITETGLAGAPPGQGGPRA